MFANVYGLRRLHEPTFRRIVIVVLALILLSFRAVQFAAFSSQDQWGYDFSFYWRAASNLIQGLPIYSPQQLAGPYVPQGQDGFLYPPPFAVVAVPLASLFPIDYRAAMWVWASVGTLILMAGTLVVARSVDLVARIRAATGLGPWILLVAVFGFPPVVDELSVGNVHALLFGLLGIAWLGLRRGDRPGERVAGAAVGIAALIKVFPALIVLWFVFTNRRRAVVWSFGAAVVAVIVTLPATGLTPWAEYPTVLLNLSESASAPDALSPTAWLSDLIGFTLARIVVTSLAVTLLAWAAGHLQTRRGFAVTVILSVLIAPALYHSYLTILVLPFLLLLPEVGALRWLALAYLLMSGGQQTALGDWSWVVNRGLPTAGMLVLLGLALRGPGRVAAQPRPVGAASP